MTRGLSQAAKKAKAYAEKHPNALTGEELARKFGLSSATVYRSEWWKNRIKPAKTEASE